MGGFGTTVIGQGGRGVKVSCDDNPLRKVGGLTIDWSTVTAVSGSDATLKDDTIVQIGDKYIRYGTILCKITTKEIQVIDLSAGDDPTAGTWTITVIDANAVTVGTTDALAWNASAATVQAALEEILGGSGSVTVAKAGFQYTLTFNESLGNMGTSTVDDDDLTGATSVTVTQSTAGVAGGGKYGPYDSGASDGRQTLTRGECFILNKTILESAEQSDYPDVIEGGLVYIDRITDITTNPSRANILTAFPMLRIVED